MTAFYIIRSVRGYWQTSKGFHSANIDDATRYSTEDEARAVCAFCVPAGITPIIERAALQAGGTVRIEPCATH